MRNNSPSEKLRDMMASNSSLLRSESKMSNEISVGRKYGKYFPKDFFVGDDDSHYYATSEREDSEHKHHIKKTLKLK